MYDQDYLDKLSSDELDWLDKFNQEYVSTTLDKDNLDNNLHNTKKLLKDCRDRNNSRNRDILTRAKAANHLTSYDDLIEEASSNSQEDDIINELDKKDARAAIDWLAEQLDRDEENLETRLLIEEKDKE